MRITEGQLRRMIRSELLLMREGQLGEDALSEAAKAFDPLIRYLDDNKIPYLLTKAGHYKVMVPGLERSHPYSIVTFASTPSDRRAGRNVKSMLRKALEDSAKAQGRGPYPELPTF